MQYYITKTGLDSFDTARAWGLTVLLNVITKEEVGVLDTSWAFLVDCPSSELGAVSLLDNQAWKSIFDEENWQRIFMTAKGGWKTKRDKIRDYIQQNVKSLLSNLQRPENSVRFGTGESLPGGLDPAGFKGLRHLTRLQYREEQLNVSEDHWALASLGMATCGTYRYAKEAGQSNWLVLMPKPQEIRFSYFRDVKDLFRFRGLRYRGVQNAAAHYAVQLAEGLRRRAAAQGNLQDRYSAVVYFRLFGAGQQVKPAQGNQLCLEPMMNAITGNVHGSSAMFEWLDYCFRLGSTEGGEPLALAVTELVMRWDLLAYERLVREALRFKAQGRIRWENLPGSDTLMEVMRHVYNH